MHEKSTATMKIVTTGFLILVFIITQKYSQRIYNFTINDIQL